MAVTVTLERSARGCRCRPQPAVVSKAARRVAYSPDHRGSARPAAGVEQAGKPLHLQSASSPPQWLRYRTLPNGYGTGLQCSRPGFHREISASCSGQKGLGHIQWVWLTAMGRGVRRLRATKSDVLLNMRVIHGIWLEARMISDFAPRTPSGKE